MHRNGMLSAFAVAMAALLLAGAARGQESENSERAAEPSADAPLDLSTPEPDEAQPKTLHPLADAPAALDWSSRVGIDYRKPSIPAANFQPAPVSAGAVPEQSTGVGWAKVAAPGLGLPLGWDQTAVETRVDPSQEQGEVRTTLSRSVPVGDDLSLTLQNGVSVTRTLPSTAGANQGWGSSQALRFNVLPTDTSVSVGANFSSTDDKWRPTLSAEQKLFGGPFSVTGSVSETASGETAKSLSAGFKRQW